MWIDETPLWKEIWQTVAIPAFKALPEEVRDLYLRICKGTLEVGIRPDGVLLLPKGSTFYSELQKYETEDLAYYSWLTFFHGWWSDKEYSFEPEPEHRVHPGFENLSNYADQILRKRLNLSVHAEPHGFSYGVKHGLLELRLTTPHFWGTFHIGLATAETLKKAREQVEDKEETDLTILEQHEANFKALSGDLKQALWPKSGPIAEASEIFDPIS